MRPFLDASGFPSLSQCISSQPSWSFLSSPFLFLLLPLLSVFSALMSPYSHKSAVYCHDNIRMASWLCSSTMTSKTLILRPRVFTLTTRKLYFWSILAIRCSQVRTGVVVMVLAAIIATISALIRSWCWKNLLRSGTAMMLIVDSGQIQTAMDFRLPWVATRMRKWTLEIRAMFLPLFYSARIFASFSSLRLYRGCSYTKDKKPFSFTYSVVVQIARSVDLNTLDSLSMTCRQFRANLLPFRSQLVRETLRCRNEPLDNTLSDRNGDGDNSTVLGFVAAEDSPDVFQGFPQPTTAASSIGRSSSIRRFTTRKVGRCARDMVAECQRCMYVYCRVSSILSLCS